MPVPASRTNSEPSDAVICTHEVLPPYRCVPGPGTGTEPADAPEPYPHQSTACAPESTTQKKIIAP